ncbi:MAG: hypothetical protein ACOYEP_01870 [Limnochordia bacterium]|jgi:hypothetical protein
MMHRIWKRFIGAYAEGRLRWPLTLLVDRHTYRCRQCRDELRRQSAFWRGIDDVLFSREEVTRTVAVAVERSLEQPAAALYILRPSAAFSAAIIACLLVFAPVGWQRWFGSATHTVTASSSWAEGVAISVPVPGGPSAHSGNTISHSSGTGESIGVSVEVYAPTEWGG